MPHWKGLVYGKDESRGLNCNCTSSICQNVLKSVNLQHKWDSVDSKLVGIVQELQVNFIRHQKLKSNVEYEIFGYRKIQLF